MPPGVPPGRSIEAFWDGHRVAGEEWGEAAGISCTVGAASAHAVWRCSSSHSIGGGISGHCVHLPSHNESDPGALAPGRTTAIECADAVQP